MSLSDIKQAFEIKVRDFAKKHSLSVSYENVPYQGKGEYLECSTLPIKPHVVTMTHQEHQAIFQVNFYMKEGESARRSDRLVEEFSSLFSIGDKIKSAEIFEPVEVSPSIKSSGKYMTAVSIYFKFNRKV
ncbi:DUF4128 domain-containing protein [Ignatzschineria rhizosphaerae]|uniref:DUF4128 domain-containing protein n=1 Tax=Ignatzschineria rhizosphaerae TaxID=2923279 RepID=A0ABY3WZA3_9GAMM|nr:phage tail terminator-like protein [Ignatzschineria rhizosphaerae]UNM95952.1 DUF4128 domain-containing protein [Ignatzschineria rhizosphaerae]